MRTETVRVHCGISRDTLIINPALKKIKRKRKTISVDEEHTMRLYLINPSNPPVSIVKVKESRWNRFRVWKPLSLMVLAGLTPREWEITIVDENLSAPDYPAMP